MEQKWGPHIEQKCASLAPSCGSVSSWNSCAFSGSSRLNTHRRALVLGCAHKAVAVWTGELIQKHRRVVKRGEQFAGFHHGADTQRQHCRAVAAAHTDRKSVV